MPGARPTGSWLQRKLWSLTTFGTPSQNHRLELSRGSVFLPSLRAITCLLLTLCLSGLAVAEDKAPLSSWRMILEPKSMRRPIVAQIPNAQRTVFAPAVLDGNDYLFPTREILEKFNVDIEAVQKAAEPGARADLAELKPRYVRDRKQVIQYAELRSERPIVASAVLAPNFLDLFKDTLGEKVLLVVPNRFQAFVFPALASRYEEYWPMVLQAYGDSTWPISVEVFEVSKDGLRAVGVYQDP